MKVIRENMNGIDEDMVSDRERLRENILVIE